MTRAKQTQPNSYFYSLLFRAERLADMPQHPHFLFTKRLVWSCLTFSARSLSIGKTYQKRTDVYSVLQREQRSSPRKAASQDLRHHLVFQLFGSGKSTLGVIVPVHSGGSGPTRFVQPGTHNFTLAIAPAPSENIIDLDIKRAVRL